LAVLAASIYVVMGPSVQTMMGQGTRGVGYLGGLLASGMVVGSLLVGTIGARWNKRHIITLGLLVMGAMMIVGSALYTFPFFVPVSIIGGLVLAPVMVSQDTFLHEAAPRSARGLIFSTRDLILGAVFMGCALAVGYAAPLLGRLGADEPFRLALGILGVLISATSLFVGMGVVRGQRSQV
jgi:MFS family permease